MSVKHADIRGQTSSYHINERMGSGRSFQKAIYLNVRIDTLSLPLIWPQHVLKGCELYIGVQINIEL